MNRSYVLVLLSVFALFFLQLYAGDAPYTLPLSIVLVVLILGATLFQIRRKPNR
ncbi:hypothetical protein [Exiguobacterium sp. AM39-5BH]|uniref:hypothetical protein n=1 Tax=Exiguobacterium sp. AM39-5BH TaxID=2292355 RepID=UPI0018F7C5A1|nr:hypothetical protein [Exiguobacterium sp. AM39-5BH]